MNTYHIVIADDHLILRHGIRSIINQMEHFEVIGEAGDGVELLKLLKKISPHLILLDITMPRLRGLEAAIEIKMILSTPRTISRSVNVKRAIQACGSNRNSMIKPQKLIIITKVCAKD